MSLIAGQNLLDARNNLKSVTELGASPMLKRGGSLTNLKSTPTRRVVLTPRAHTTGRKQALMRKQRSAVCAKRLTYDFERLRRLSPIPAMRKSPELSPAAPMTPTRTASGSPVLSNGGSSPYRKRPVQLGADAESAVGVDTYFSEPILKRLERKPYYGFGEEEGTITTLSMDDLIYLAGHLENDLSFLIRTYKFKDMEVGVAKMKAEGLKAFIGLAKLGDASLSERLVPSEDAELIERYKDTEQQLERVKARYAALEAEHTTLASNFKELQLINVDAQAQSEYLRLKIANEERGEQQSKERIKALEMLLAIEKDATNASRIQLDAREAQVMRLSQAVVVSEETARDIKAVMNRHEKK